MNKIDSLIADVRALQDYLDWRTEQEDVAIQLISSNRLDEAIRVLEHIDEVSIEDFMS